MPRRTLLTVAATAVALAAVAAPGGATAPDGATVKVAFNKAIGKTILVDARGHTLYVFELDTSGKSTCDDDATYHCSKAWPPLVTKGKPRAGKGVRAGLLGTTRRDDGRVQVTYKHQPLYTFVKDTGGFGKTGDRKPGDAHGQTYANLWWVVAPSGKAIKTACKTRSCD